MIIKYHELKEVIYIAEAAMGLLFIVCSIYQLHLGGNAASPASHFVTAFILMLIGTACVFFAVETYLLRDDPDIWR